DEGLQRVGSLASLTQLVLSATEITDAGLRSIENLKSLEQLTLGAWNEKNGLKIPPAKITDEALEHVSRLPRLRELNLQGCHVGDPGLKYLRQMPSLVNLDLSDTQLTDDALPSLAELPGLRRVKICGPGNKTKVTMRAVEKLHRLLPALEIE